MKAPSTMLSWPGPDILVLVSLVEEQLFNPFRQKDESSTQEHDVNGRELLLCKLYGTLNRY